MLFQHTVNLVCDLAGDESIGTAVDILGDREDHVVPSVRLRRRKGGGANIDALV
jgi:hypothetical protein